MTSCPEASAEEEEGKDVRQGIFNGMSVFNHLRSCVNIDMEATAADATEALLYSAWRIDWINAFIKE
jgi:hypothetical protein